MSKEEDPLRVYAIHGLGGAPSDWDRLKSAVEDLNYEWICIDAYQAHALNEIRFEKKQVIVITHSWGAYLLIKALALGGISDKFKKIILINPYVQVERPLSRVALFLLKIPWINDSLIKMSHRKASVDFIYKLLSPYKITDYVFFTEIETRLQQWTELKKIVHAKIKHQLNPLSLNLKFEVPAVILIGLKDKTMSNHTQISLIKKFFKNIEVIEYAEDGHGLLWTRVDKIRELLK
jgi:pimeloyl-ACP methyl ester carboxylesterase